MWVISSGSLQTEDGCHSLGALLRKSALVQDIAWIRIGTSVWFIVNVDLDI